MNAQLANTSRVLGFPSTFNLIDAFFGPDFFGTFNALNSEPYPTDQFWDKDGNLNIEVPLAGYKREDISLSIEKDYLVLKAAKQNRHNAVHYVNEGIRKKELVRRWLINGNFEQDKIESKFEDGLLTITLPPKQKEVPKIKQITIGGG